MMRWAPARPSRPGCPHRRLRTLLTRALPHGATLGASTFRPWASANFVGARHLFPCTLATGDAAMVRAALLDRLSAIDWPFAGHIVADVAVECGAAPLLLEIEILTVED